MALEETASRFRKEVVAEIAAQQAYFARQLKRHRQARVVVLVSAGLVPVLTPVDVVPRYVLGVLGAIAAITEALIQLYRWRDSAVAAQRTANALETQLNLYRTATEPYHEELDLAFHKFVVTIETIRSSAAQNFAGIWAEDRPPSAVPPPEAAPQQPPGEQP